MTRYGSIRCCEPVRAGNNNQTQGPTMKRPSKLGTLALSIYLIASGALPILHLNSPTFGAITNIAALAAGVLIWLDR